MFAPETVVVWKPTRMKVGHKAEVIESRVTKTRIVITTGHMRGKAVIVPNTELREA